MKIIRYGVLVAALLPQWSHASIGINSMIEFAERGEGQFTISNAENFRQFISVAISAITVENGELVKTPYTRDNIDKWSLTVRPARTVIDANLSKSFKVRYDPTLLESKDHDKMYQLTFVPTPYFKQGEPAKHAVQVAIGFAPIFVVPAEKDQPLNYEVTFKGTSVQLNNPGGTYIRAFFDACPNSMKGTKREACSRTAYALSGRHLTVSLPESMQKASSLKAEFSTHNLTYQKKLTLNKNQTIKG
jgi:P pilus assembly chaperone PapD